MRAALLSIMLSYLVVIGSIAQTTKEPVAAKVSICELAASPDRFDGRNLTVHAHYFINWEWGTGLQGQGCKGVPVRYSTPASAYIPLQYSTLKIDQNAGYRAFKEKEKLLCNGMKLRCDYDTIEADFTGTFVSWKRLTGTAPVGRTESVLIVTRISDPKLREREAQRIREPAPTVPDKIPESKQTCSLCLGQPGCGLNPCSPVILDTTGHGFVLTDPEKGEYVSFDMQGNGNLVKLSWPKAGSGNAWLVYDRDGDGVIKDGTELFGNFTPHADWNDKPNPNGFSALGWYDLPAQGGNMDAMISKEDAIWKELRLWIDTHCYKTPNAPCQSLPSELHTLESKGINSLSLVVSASSKTDAIGNRYELSAPVNPVAHDVKVDEHGNSCCDLHMKSKDGRLAYDVFLATKK